MTDTKKESLSALIDGEASEIEVHRLVREYGDDASLRSSWATFQQVRSVVRNDSTGLTPAQHIELHQRISAAIETEELYDGGPLAVPARSKRMPAVAASVAVAASLVVAVFVGVNQQTTETAAPEVAAAPAALVAPPPTGMVSARAAADIAGNETPELIELDEDKQQRLRNYLYQHDRMSRMNDNTQFVNYQRNGDK